MHAEVGADNFGLEIVESITISYLRGVVLFQRTVVLLSFYVLSSLIVKVSHRGDRCRDAVYIR